MSRGRLGLAAAFGGGALLALTLPPVGWWPLGWVALVPFFAAPSAASGLAAGLGFHAVAFHWIYQTCRFAHVPVPVALLAWAALALVLALNWALVGWLCRRLKAEPLAAAAIWTAVAWLSGFTPRLAGDLPAYPQWPNLALIQCGSGGGPHLLGFVVVWANAALARRRLAPLALVALLWLHGAWTLRNRTARPGVPVALLQPNVDQYQKWDSARAASIEAGFSGLLARTGAAKLIVWPETALPFWSSRKEAPRLLARRRGATHLVGVLVREGPANGLQDVGPDGAVRGFYAKRERVPFGEFVPLRGLIPRFVIEHGLGILDQFGDMEAGAPTQDLLPTPLGPAAATICYEALFPGLLRRDAARGAALAVNVTNDGWYKDTWGPYQHFQANVYRAIENRLTVVRSGNTGISAVIDPWGVVLARQELNTRGTLVADAPASPPSRPLYTRWGDWIGWLSAAAALLLAWRRR